MDFWLQLVMLMSVFGLALISPGPDLVMAIRNSLSYSRLAGIFTAFGFAGGVAIHVTYVLIGLATIIAQSAILFTIIKIIGAGYLFYMGYKALRSKGFDDETEINRKRQAPSITMPKAFLSGFLTNLLNPKATLFFLAIFAQFIPHTTMAQQLIMGGTCVIMTAVWFTIVAVILTHGPVRNMFLKASKWIDRVCGGLFIALGIKLILTKGAPS